MRGEFWAPRFPALGLWGGGGMGDGEAGLWSRRSRKCPGERPEQRQMRRRVE